MTASLLPEWAQDRVVNLQELDPNFFATVRFYGPDESRRQSPVPNGFGCLCLLDPEINEGNDARLLFDKDWIELGEKVTARFFFTLGEEVAPRFRRAKRFYLWEGDIVGEVEVLEKED